MIQAAANQTAAADVQSPQSPPPSPPESPRNSGFDGKRNSKSKAAAKEAKGHTSEAKEGEEGEGESRRRHRKSRASRVSGAAEQGESPVASRGASMTDNMLPAASVSFEPVAKKDTSAITPGADTSAQKGPSLEVATAPLQKKGYLFPQGATRHDEKQRSLRNDMLQLGVCKLDRLMLKSNGNMIFRDQHADVFSRWMYPIAYVGMMLFFYTTLPEQSESSTTDNHAAGVPAYCSGRGSNMLAGLEL